MKEYLTKENKAELEAELKELMGPRRKAIIDALEYAKSLGDLSENAEYHSAREAQGQLQERISAIEYVLNHAVVVARTFVLVGSEETDMLSGKISYKSPIGAALYGKQKGDTVTVTTPKGDMDYQIVSVE